MRTGTIRPLTILALVIIAVCCGGARAQDGGGASAASEKARTLKLTLDQAMALAVKNNLDLRVAVLDEQIQRAKIREALGAFDPVAFADITGSKTEILFAGNFPNPDPNGPPTVTRIISTKQDDINMSFGVRGVLETGTSYSVTFEGDYNFTQGGSAINPVWTNATRISLTQPILRAGWDYYHRAPVELARIDAMTAYQTYRSAVRDKLKEVQQAYYDLVFAIEDRKVKENSRDIAVRQIRDTEVKVNTGGLPKVEVTAAKSAKAGRDADLVTAKAAVRESEDRLRRLILAFEREADWQTQIVPLDTAAIKPVNLVPVSRIIQIAERSEPRILEAHLSVAQAEVQLRQRSSEKLPKLDLTGNASVVGLDDDASTAQQLSYSHDGAFSWSMLLSFEYPLGNRAADAREAQARLTLTRARISLQNTRTEVAFDIRNTIRDIEVALESIAARRKAKELAAEQLENERLKLDLRTSTNLDVFQVEEQLSQRTTEEIRALLDYRLALWELVRVTGVPLEELLVKPPTEEGDEGKR